MYAHVLVAVFMATSLPSPARGAVGDVTPALAATKVRAAALPLANRLRVTLGRPSCPSGVPAKAGTVFQCTVAMGDASVPYAVTVQPDGSLVPVQLWAVLSTSSVSAVAGPKATCGKQKVLARAVGSSVKCTVAGRTVNVLIRSLDGSVGVN